MCSSDLKQRVIGSSPIGPIFMSEILKSSLCVCIEAIFFCDNFQILFRTADIDLISDSVGSKNREVTVSDQLKEIRSWRSTGHLPMMQPESF